MAVRTTATAVKVITGSNLDDSIVDAFISAANAFVNEILGTASSTILTNIEMFIAAHLLTISRERLAKKEGAGGAFIDYAGIYTMGLKATQYGQTAIDLGTTGALAALGLKAASITAATSFS